jgi:hypothetical protein
MSQKQIQSSDSTCISSTDQQQIQYQRSNKKNFTGPITKKKTYSMDFDLKTKRKNVRENTLINSMNNLKTRNKKKKSVRFKGNGSINQMVEIVNVESYKEYNLDLAFNKHHYQDNANTTCSCLLI